MKNRLLYHEIDDSGLWKLLIKGDKLALEIIYRRYFSPLLKYGITICGNEDLVKDCIQELFVRIHNNKDLRSVIYVKSYLLKALKNSLLNELSSMREHSFLDEECFNLPFEDEEMNFLFPKDDNDLQYAFQLKNAYKQLSANQQKAVYLYFIQELSWVEMADVLKITPHSSMNLIARSVAKLRKLMEENEKNDFFYKK